jgi:hypothetical protein
MQGNGRGLIEGTTGTWIDIVDVTAKIRTEILLNGSQKHHRLSQVASLCLLLVTTIKHRQIIFISVNDVDTWQLQLLALLIESQYVGFSYWKLMPGWSIHRMGSEICEELMKYGLGSSVSLIPVLLWTERRAVSGNCSHGGGFPDLNRRQLNTN